MEDIDGGLHPAVDGQSLDEMRWDYVHLSVVYIFPLVDVHIRYMCSNTAEFFHTCHGHRHYWLLRFYTSFVTLNLAGNDKVSTTHNLLASFSHTLFNCMGWNLLWGWGSSRWTSRDYFWVTFIRSREISTALLTALKDISVGMHSNIYEHIWLKLCMMIDTTKLYILILNSFYFYTGRLLPLTTVPH